MEPERFGLHYAGKAEAVRRAHERSAARLRCDEPASIGFADARDVLVEGDNLEVLKLLRPAYAGTVQCIYIDPPYNTGHDFVYRDRTVEDVQAYLRRSGQVDDEGMRLRANPETHGRYHSHWLAMMEPRLRVAHELMHDDGVLFVSIDDHEVHHLRVLLDEIFGPECFVAQVVVVSNRGGRDYLRIATTHEYVLCYGKSPDAVVRPLARERSAARRVDRRGPYELRELRNRNPRFSPDNRPNLFYPIWADAEAADPEGLCPVALGPIAGGQRVEPRNREGAAGVWRWGQPKLRAAIVPGDPEASEVVARRRRDGVFNVYEKHRATTTKPRSVWDESMMRSEEGTRTLREHLGVAAFDHPKPVALVQRCVRLGAGPGALVLDFFAGSGTTAEAVMALDDEDGGQRRYLLVQLPEVLPEQAPARALGAATIADVTRLRIAAARSVDRGVRCFRIEASRVDASMLESGLDPGFDPGPDPWAVALRSGLPLHAAIEGLGPRTWAIHHDERRLVVSFEPVLTSVDAEGWALRSGTAVACRADALDDELAYNLARRHPLSLL
ncbi:site-specific DNA-methyltransferase [Paraliomyxa miuraensis]|uniref:site-specific DNA-methyltransferase n=1 Tax=Paraliomyxa miuraensis TaxID=376150 RepID=UPI002250C774|nr:site-specific DNA-methyltransferase [Paraliomyxa miuraensis]MCX4243245.1 site-specific DNA-methyltransferase [Paraliomyxa miuraensis]